MAYVGGLRARLIRDAVYDTVMQGLVDLGYFSSGRNHKPVTFLPHPVDNEVEVKPNVVALLDDDDADDPMELGSNLSQVSWDFEIDVYAEDSSFGIQASRDIKDLLAGRMQSIGRDAPILEVWDSTLATPVHIFNCDIENIERGRVKVSAARPWEKFWYTVFFTIVDSYENENG